MKKVLVWMLVSVILLSVVSVGAATVIAYGDADGNGKIDNHDLGLLQRYINGWDVKLGPTGTTTVTTTTTRPTGADVPEAEMLTIEAANTLGLSLEEDTYTEEKYFVSGTVSEIYNGVHGALVITDGVGNNLAIYGTFSADGTYTFGRLLKQPKVGDALILYGVIGRHNGAAQMQYGWIIEHNGKTPEVYYGPTGSATTTATRPTTRPNTTRPAADSTVSIQDAIAIGLSMESNTYTTDKYYVTGTVTEVYNEQYGNMKITDGEGNILTIYGSFGPDGNVKFNQLSPQPKVGDTVKVYGIVGQYNDVPQLKNGWIMEINGKRPGNATPTTRPNTTRPAADSTVSIQDAIAIGLSMESNTYTTDKYYVTGTVTEVYNEQYGNMKITDGEGNILTLYGTFSADGKYGFNELNPQPKAGDTVTVYGRIGQFAEVPQLKNGWIIWINGKTPTVQGQGGNTPASGLSVVTAPKVGVAYKFGMVQENVSKTNVFYLTGVMSGYYMDTATNVNTAIDVYLEHTDGGYYLYTMKGTTKTYLNMLQEGAHVNGRYETTAKTVYTYDATFKTLIANVAGRDYYFGTRSDRSYTTVGPYAVTNGGYYCMFYEEQ